METVVKTDQVKIACVLVGLPARGKTFISHKVSRYLQWLGVVTRVFNVGNYRRKLAGAQVGHEFFRHDNQQANGLRMQAAMEALDDMLDWLLSTMDWGDSGGGRSSSLSINRELNETTRVAIYDATNSTHSRRQIIHDKCQEKGIQVMFIESICTDDAVIMNNIREVKLSSPDYINTDSEKAAEDFKARIAHYEESYETLGDVAREENDWSYVKMIDIGSQHIINMINGYLQSRVVYYLMNLHPSHRSIFMSRHGESMFNLSGRIGGDADLSPRGQMFAKALPGVIMENIPESQNLTVWTSTLKRTIQTAEFLPFPKLQWKALDELDAGVCDGMTYAEIEELFPQDFAERDKDKYHYRYRGGESYKDLVLRLEPIIMELERQENIIIIGHQAVLRAIYAYFFNLPKESLPYIHIPLHTIIKLTPKAYGCEESFIKIGIDAVDTHRPKPDHGKRSSYGDKCVNIGQAGAKFNIRSPLQQEQKL